MVAIRTTEGLPGRCPVCGKRISTSPGEPLGEVVCPHCGVLFYPEFQSGADIPDHLQRLKVLGVDVETDDEGEVTRVVFNGPAYNDRSIPGIAKLQGVPIIDIRNASISQAGADCLRLLLPDAQIER